MSVGRTWFRADDMTVQRLRVKESKWQPLASSRPRQRATDRLAYRPPNRVVTASYILATKLEAFAGRGGDDYLASPDLEDIVTLVDGRAQIIREVMRADADLWQFLAKRFSTLLATPRWVGEVR
jgi:hypothetical protein